LIGHLLAVIEQLKAHHDAAGDIFAAIAGRRRGCPPKPMPASLGRAMTQLLAYTQDRFGETARQRYEALLVAGLRGIADPLPYAAVVGQGIARRLLRSYSTNIMLPTHCWSRPGHQ
jgi:hypothetical protein